MLVKATVALIFPVVFLFLIWPSKMRRPFWLTFRQFCAGCHHSSTGDDAVGREEF